jgi:hypothetical protein
MPLTNDRDGPNPNPLIAGHRSVGNNIKLLRWSGFNQNALSLAIE